MIFIFMLVSTGATGTAFGQVPPSLSVTVDSFTVVASRFLAGKVDSADLFLAARAVVKGDSAKHGWLRHFSPIELKSEETYDFFPGLRLYRFFTPNYKIPPGHAVAIDRERQKSYLLYQSGAPDDLGEMVLNRGVKIPSDTAALEYFLQVLQIRGYLPAIILDTIAEIRQFCRYRERAAGLKLSQLPPVERLYRHLWEDKNFAPFKKGRLSEERDSVCRRLEASLAGTVCRPFAYFQKEQYFIEVFLVRTRKLFEVYKFSAFVSPEGQVSYTVKILE